MDVDGNVQLLKPVPVTIITREQYNVAYQVCSNHIEGLSFGSERTDVTEQVDKYLAIATCLNEKGFDIDESTIENIEQWPIDFRVEFNWDDPVAKTAYEE